MPRSPVIVGAVLYDPKVSAIWEIIQEFFATQGCDMEPVFFTNYTMQVDALVGGHVHVAWNSPLAWVDAVRRLGPGCRALAMRDTDRDRVTRVLVRADSGLTRLADLRGRRVATGAADSPQATLLPLHLLANNGLHLGRDVRVLRHDVLVGKHGDHVGGELEALRALERGDADAACVLDLNWDLWSRDGTVPAESLRVLASTPPFDHCNFTVRPDFPRERAEAWSRALFAMRYDIPEHQAMMDMEGLKAWLPGRTSGYQALTEAVHEQHFFEASGA